MKRVPNQKDIIDATNFIRRSYFVKNGVCRANMTDKQFNQVVDVMCYFRTANPCLLKKQSVERVIPKMIAYGVDNLFVARLCRKIRLYRNTTASLMSFLILYSKKGYDLYEEYRRKQAETNSFEYKAKKFGMTREQFDEYNKNRAVTLENMIARHGEEAGREKYEAYCKRQSYAGCTLEYFIEKYGEVEGRKVYKEVGQRKAITVENFMKAGLTEEEATEKLRLIVTTGKNTSLIADEFNDMLYARLNAEDQGHCYFDKNNKEFGVYDKVNKRYYLYDFTITSKKIIIEFNGNLYHADPNIYAADDLVPLRGGAKRAIDIWKFDLDKKKAAEARGFSVIYVWENDFRENKEAVVDKVMGMIYD